MPKKTPTKWGCLRNSMIEHLFLIYNLQTVRKSKPSTKQPRIKLRENRLSIGCITGILSHDTDAVIRRNFTPRNYAAHVILASFRSEERRVGEECGSRW